MPFAADVVAGLLPIDEIAALANAGTLIAFTSVGISLLVLRRRCPELPRPFRTPAAWLVGVGAVGGCAYLFLNLPTRTLALSLAWNVVGLAIYVLYGRRRSVLARAGQPS